jgi:hypothetical protein
MPFTEQQRKYFNAAASRGEAGMKKLADEANRLKKKGIELPPKKPDEDDHRSPWEKLHSGK